MGSAIGLDSSDVDKLAAQLVRIGDELTDLAEPNADAAATVLRGVNPPRRTGQLAAAGRSDVSPNGWVLAYPIRYATFVHWGVPSRNQRAQPWLVQERDDQYDNIAAIYADAAQDTINRLT